MQEQFVGLGVEVGAGDFGLLVEILCGDAADELVSGLIIKFGNLAMAVFVFDDVLGGVGGDPDGDGELQVYVDVRDDDGGVDGVGEASGGMSGGGAVGSKVRLVKLTGCLVMLRLEFCVDCWGDEELRQMSQPRRSAPTKTERAMSERTGCSASGLYFANMVGPKRRVCVCV